MGGEEKVKDNCNCLQCLRDRDERTPWGWPVETAMMIVCSICGNKRCPHATDHRNECTNSNEIGQVGSRYAMGGDANDR